MIMHVIESGETAYTIANDYNISAEWLVRENGIVDPNDLAVGGVLVILYPRITHTLVEGDTLENIANMYDVTVMDLLRNNSYLSNLEYLRVGDTIVIEYECERIRNLTIIGYCFNFIDEDILRKTLPYLTYLIIHSYVINSYGQFVDLNDLRVIELAKDFGVAPVMIITLDESEGMTATDILHLILNDENLKINLIEDIIRSLIQKGYSGLSVGPVYIYPSDEQLYIEFMTVLTCRVKAEGLMLFDTIVPNTFSLISDVFTTEGYILEVNRLIDSTIIFPISVGLAYGSLAGIASYHALLDMMDYVLEYFESDELQLGINSVGYMWQLPYVPGESTGNAISAPSAIQLARDYNIPILFDRGTQAAFFKFQEGNTEYLIRFRDTRSVLTLLSAVNYYKLNGIGVWNIEAFFNGLWLLVNSQYYIDKVDL